MDIICTTDTQQDDFVINDPNKKIKQKLFSRWTAYTWILNFMKQHYFDKKNEADGPFILKPEFLTFD